MTKESKIYELYADLVYKYLLKLTRDPDLAEELTQDTFYKAILHINGFQEECSMYTWLCEIAKNSYLNEKRKQERKRKKEVRESASSEDFVQGLLKKEQAFEVHQALHGIAEPYKEVFTLKVFGELSHGEIARLFGKTESWAKVTFYRAKKMILEQMEE